MKNYQFKSSEPNTSKNTGNFLRIFISYQSLLLLNFNERNDNWYIGYFITS